MRLIVVLVMSVAMPLFAADWPCWRGPDGLGVSAAKNLPTEWSKDKNIAWKTPIPGFSASSPILLKDRIYLTTQTLDMTLHVLGLEANSGKISWDREVARARAPKNKIHNMATPTPLTDGQRIYALFGTGDLIALDQDGKALWQRQLFQEYGEYNSNHGYGTSPLLHDNRLYVACMHQGPSYLLALDPATGKNLWKIDRNLGSKTEAQDSYSSPIFFKDGDRTEIILEGAEAVTGYDPATGRQTWMIDGLTVPHPYGRTISGLAAGEGIVVAVASGFQNRGYTVGIKPRAADRLWTSSKYSPDCPSPLIYNGYVYTMRDDGMASCLDLKTGAALWQERLFSANVKVSPVAADGKIYFLNGQGNCVVVKASPQVEILSTNQLNEATLASPAIGNNRLLIRTQSTLYSIQKSLQVSSARAAN
jgi:outer membrane protein assembly factor BamB